MHYLITGGTGFIGSALCADLLSAGQRVTVLTRDRENAARRLPAGAAAIESLDELAPQDTPEAVVNLAGESLASGRWSAARKRRFFDSRIGTTRRLVDWLGARQPQVRVLVSGSAVGYYGARGDEELTEDAAPGDEFQADLCKAWEAEAVRAESLGVRVCRVRTGIVLGPGGGALAAMLPAFRLGLGGWLGSGRQWMSWIHRADLIALIRWLAESGAPAGAYNGTAPYPATNRQFAQALGRALKRPVLLPVPGFALRALAGEMAHLLLTGQKVLPKRALDGGFTFRFPTVASALADALDR